MWASPAAAVVPPSPVVVVVRAHVRPPLFLLPLFLILLIPSSSSCLAFSAPPLPLAPRVSSLSTPLAIPEPRSMLSPPPRGRAIFHLSIFSYVPRVFVAPLSAVGAGPVAPSDAPPSHEEEGGNLKEEESGGGGAGGQRLDPTAVEWRLRSDPNATKSRRERWTLLLASKAIRWDCLLRRRAVPPILCPKGGRAVLEAHYRGEESDARRGECMLVRVRSFRRSGPAPRGGGGGGGCEGEATKREGGWARRGRERAPKSSKMSGGNRRRFGPGIRWNGTGERLFFLPSRLSRLRR